MEGGNPNPDPVSGIQIIGDGDNLNQFLSWSIGRRVGLVVTFKPRQAKPAKQNEN